jgi:CubicO group peptidase (beta-lactamase class C family)
MNVSRPRLRRCRVPRDLASVTTLGPEAEAAAAGLDKDVPERIWKAVQWLYRSGMHPGIQFCLRRRGEIVVNRAIGHARGNGPGDPKDGPKELLTPKTPICIFSASKAITAMLVHLLDDRGVLHVDDRVVEYIPEFGRAKKEWITLRHILTHRAGISTVPPEYNNPEMLSDWPNIVALLCEAEPSSRAGRKLAYHALTGGFVLGEVIQRVTGKSLRGVLRDEITDPLGFDLFDYGIEESRLGEVALNYPTGPQPPWPISRVPHNALGMAFDTATELSNSPDFLTAVVPSGNIVSNAEQCSRFFEMLRRGGELDGTRVMDPRTVHRAAVETSYLEIDFSLMLPFRYGVGLMLGGKTISPFGVDTMRAYGHLGFINIHVWADPARELSCALMTTGKPFVSVHLPPLLHLLNTISRSVPKTG